MQIVSTRLSFPPFFIASRRMIKCPSLLFSPLVHVGKEFVKSFLPFSAPCWASQTGKKRCLWGLLGVTHVQTPPPKKGVKEKTSHFTQKWGKEKSFRKGIRISRGKSVAQFPVLEIPIKDQQLKQSPPPPPPPPPLPPVSNFQLVRSDEEISQRRKIFSPDPFDFTQSEKCLGKKNSWGIRRGAKKYTSFFFPFLAGKLE